MSLSHSSGIGSGLSVIIVNWNTCELLENCLYSLFEELQRFDNPEVIVVDNASTDGSAAMIKGQFPCVRLIENAKNLGFAAANNIALREARSESICLLNPDTIVIDHALKSLWNVLHSRPNVGIVGAQLLNADGSAQASVGTFPSIWSELPLINRPLSSMQACNRIELSSDVLFVKSVDWVSGACLMTKRDIIESIGFLDEGFWLYTEETDWCFRCKVAGWDVLLVPQAQVQHLARAASRQRFVETMLHFYRSRVRFVHKHRGRRQAEGIRTVLRVKSAIWGVRPQMSPLHKVYADLSDNEIRCAYRLLRRELSLSLDAYLDGVALAHENLGKSAIESGAPR